MKKTVVLFTLLLCLVGMHAQNTVTNGDFELWSYGKPVGWTGGLYGTLTSYVNIPVEMTFCTQTTDAHTGSYAVKVEAADFTFHILVTISISRVFCRWAKRQDFPSRCRI